MDAGLVSGRGDGGTFSSGKGGAHLPEARKEAGSGAAGGRGGCAPVGGGAGGGDGGPGPSAPSAATERASPAPRAPQQEARPPALLGLGPESVGEIPSLNC